MDSPNAPHGIAGSLTALQVYITILASLPTLSPGLRSSINQNLTDIIQLHEDLLGDLHRVVPHSEYSQLDAPSTSAKLERGSQGHRRWKSLDAVLEDKTSLSLLQEIPGMTTEAQVAAEVAKVFSKQVSLPFAHHKDPTLIADAVADESVLHI